MSSTIIMPQLGETVAEGKILTWFRNVGDDIKLGDKLFEVETDKVTVEVEATVTGRLNEIRVNAGSVAKVGAVVAVLGTSATDSMPHAEKSVTPPARERAVFEEVVTPTTNYGAATTPDGLKITPLARRLIAQNGLELASISAAVLARGGKRISAEDVLPTLAESAAKAPSALPSPTPLSSIRQKTADRLAENWRNIPHVFQAIEIDFTAVDKARSRAKQSFKAAHGIGLTFLPFIARATCIALAEFPNINARFDGKSLSPAPEINLGIAVDLDHKGLVVPVVKNAGDLTVEGLAKAIGRLVEKARSARLTADDMAGGTYSITNNGAFGTLFTSPIINAPQVAILSTDAIRKRPVVVETPQGDFIAARPTGIVGQSFDHRAFDGAYSAAFLSRLKAIIETRNWNDDIALP